MELTKNAEERLVKLIASVKDSGWTRRRDGSWSRLLKFTEAVPDDLYPHVVMLYYLVDAPREMLNTQTTHRETMGINRDMLRLRVYPIANRDQPPTSSRVAVPAPTNQLFGLPGMAVA